MNVGGKRGMNGKKRLTAALLLLIAALLLPAAVQAAAKPYLEMKASYVSGEAKVVITGQNLEDLYAYHLFLSHDVGHVKLKQAKSGSAGFSVTPPTEDGHIEFAFTKVGPIDGTSGSAVLAELVFEVLSPGESTLVLDTAELVNSAIQKTVLEPSISQSLHYFRDMAGHWSETNVYAAAATGFVNGYANGTFQPDRNVTRAEFAIMLGKALDLEPGQRTRFADDGDIPEWARGYVAAAVQAGWIDGYDDGTFRPDRDINREEMAIIAARAGKLAMSADGTTGFEDDEVISAWAKGAVAAARQQGVITGMGDGTFRPQGFATRAQAVTVILKLMK